MHSGYLCAQLRSAVIILSKEKPRPSEGRGIGSLTDLVFSRFVYFKLLIALLPLEWRVPFVPEWAPFEPTAEL
jgi:hypothetical protein